MTPLERLARQAQRTVASGYYDGDGPTRPGPSLAEAIAPPTARVVAEIKPASPTRGPLREIPDAGALAASLVDAGASGLSVLTEPHDFGGSLGNLEAAAKTGAPVLLKDLLVDERQLEAALRGGASIVLLIPEVLAHLGDAPPRDELIDLAHARELEVLIEVYDEEGLREALATDADVVGINNRDLRHPDLPVDPGTTARVLEATDVDRPAMALSGVTSPQALRRQLEAGADACLVGTHLMTAPDPAKALRELLA